MAEEQKNADFTLSFRDLAGAMFRMAIVLFGILASYAWSRHAGDIEEVARGVHAARQQIGDLKERLGEQNVRIAVIESTTKRTEAIVAEEAKSARQHAERISRVENRCCK